MHIDSPLDVKIKGTMIKDMLNLSGIHLPVQKDVTNGTVKPVPLSPNSGNAHLPTYQNTTINADADEKDRLDITNDDDDDGDIQRTDSLGVDIPSLVNGTSRLNVCISYVKL